MWKFDIFINENLYDSISKASVRLVPKIHIVKYLENTHSSQLLVAAKTFSSKNNSKSCYIEIKVGVYQGKRHWFLSNGTSFPQSINVFSWILIEFGYLTTLRIPIWKWKLKSSKPKDYPFNAYAEFSEKLTFLTQWYAHECVHIRG